MTRRIFIDAEFTALPWEANAGLLWLGLADESGRTWSAVNRDVDLSTVGEFSQNHVVPQIPLEEPRLTMAEMAPEVIRFCGSRVEFWAWCPTETDIASLGVRDSDVSAMRAAHWDFDFVLLRRVIPVWSSRWSPTCGDVQEFARMQGLRRVPRNAHPHHPAFDAMWAAEVFKLASELT